MSGRFVRLAERGRSSITLSVDGEAVQALEGDTVLVALLQASGRLRTSEFGDGERAGFCLMGACQDCWVTTEGDGRLRACTTPAEDGMRIVTKPAGATWPNLG
jgi:D-hydroxyproline dehydrogenase subunit gamma